MSDNTPARPDVRRLAARLAHLNRQWRTRAPLPDGSPFVYSQYRHLMRCIIAEHREELHDDD